ncbi:MAG: hypothetical protein M1827_006746 [Pycnora praestabilis]|nr:MAG: hypothetical protein M1827_006746 [Pycnora praestabilis]
MATIAKDAMTSPHEVTGSPTSEKRGFEHTEGDDDRAFVGIALDESQLPKGYFTSSFFIGTMLAVGLGLAAGVGGFALAAPILTFINEDIGPDPSYVWVSLVYTLTLAIGLTLVGRLSDLFGRRWLMIGGSILALIGCIVCATAKDIPTLIGGQTLIGLAASSQQSFAIISGELVPVKYRFLANAYIYVWCIPISGLAPAVANAFILYTAAGWRWCYYLMIIVNALSGICFFLFYHPPTFHMKFGARSKMEQLKNLDYVGIVLFSGGLLVFLLGISWGGSVHPWKSASVIVTIIIGFLTLVAFFIWEIYAPLKEPLIPMYLFKDISWVAPVLLLSIGASVYYAFDIVWPTMVLTLYTADQMRAGWLSCIVGCGICLGEIAGGVLAAPIGKTKYQMMTAITVGGTFLGAVASSTPDTLGRSAAFLFIGCTAIGWNESITLSLAGIVIKDQADIGTAIGVAGSIRSAISTVAATIYTVVLSNRLAIDIPAQVPPAVIKAGLPASSVPTYLAAFASTTPATAFAAVKGITPAIMAVGAEAYKSASADAYRTVFFTTIAWSGVAVILTFFAPNVDSKMTGDVAATLHRRNDETVVGAEKLVES